MSTFIEVVDSGLAVIKLRSLGHAHAIALPTIEWVSKLEARTAENLAHMFFCLEIVKDVEAVLDQFGLSVSLAQTCGLASIDDIVGNCMKARTQSGGDPAQRRVDLERLLLEARAPMIERFIELSHQPVERISLDTLLAGFRKLHDAAQKLAAATGAHPDNSLLFGAGQLVTNIAVGACGILQFSYDPALAALMDSEEPERELFMQLEAATAAATAGTGRDAQQVCTALMIYVYELCCEAEKIALHFCGAAAALN